MSKNEPFAPWQCPLCGEKLTGDSTLKCTKGHCFDRAKEGYWHLLPVQSMRTKAPGDSKEMVAARRAFLNAGYYGIFGKAVGELCAEYGQPASPEAALHLLDAGCGEGWYDRCIAQQFAAAEKPLQLAGFDIAKPAVRLAAKALPAAQYAVASSFSQPVRTGWADVLKAFHRNDTIDLLLIAVRPDLQKKGVNAVIISKVMHGCFKIGVKQAETGPMLETNEKVQTQWQDFPLEQHKRRRCFVKVLTPAPQESAAAATAPVGAAE